MVGDTRWCGDRHDMQHRQYHNIQLKYANLLQCLKQYQHSFPLGNCIVLYATRNECERRRWHHHYRQ